MNFRMDSRKCTRLRIRKRLNKAILIRKESRAEKSLNLPHKDGRWMVHKVDTASEHVKKEINTASDTTTQSH